MKVSNFSNEIIHHCILDLCEYYRRNLRLQALINIQFFLSIFIHFIDMISNLRHISLLFVLILFLISLSSVDFTKTTRKTDKLASLSLVHIILFN